MNEALSAMDAEDLIRERFRHAGIHLASLQARQYPQETAFIALVAPDDLRRSAALGVPGGRVEVNWKVRRKKFGLSWRESGGPAVSPPTRRGFGSSLLERAVAYDLQGQADLQFASDGLRYELSAPLDKLIEPDRAIAGFGTLSEV